MRINRVLFLATVLAPLAGCAAEVGDESTLADELVGDPCAGAPGIGNVGFREVARTAEVDFGSPRTLHLAVSVDDAAIASQFWAYDGATEQVFACVPLRGGPYGGGPRRRRVDLAYQETFETPERVLDVHRVSIPVDDSMLLSRGVYFGIITNGNVIWAQWPGEDVGVLTISREPTSRPL